MTIQDIFTLFDNQCNLALNIIPVVNQHSYLLTDEKKTIRDFVVKQAFINVFTEWEHFLEKTTIAYTLGEPSIKGFSPLKYVNPIDEDHAENLIKGTANYPDWSDIEKVLKIEKTLFKDGEPYSTALHGFSAKFKDIKKVRNIIVHNSKKSSEEFNSVVRTSLRASSVGISPVEFLLSHKNSAPYFYVIFITHLNNAARIISEYTP